MELARTVLLKMVKDPSEALSRRADISNENQRYFNVIPKEMK